MTIGDKIVRPVFKHPLFNFLFIDQRFLQEGDPLLEKMKDLVGMFDYLITFLRDDFPNKHINELCNLAFMLINQRVIVVGQGPRLPTNFGFALMGTPGDYEPMIVVREDWLSFVVNDRTMGLGAIVLAASQCRDYYNGKSIKDLENCEKRAAMYEAEMLLTLKQHEDFKSNDWQQEILRRFPKGIDQRLLYPAKPFMGAA